MLAEILEKIPASVIPKDWRLVAIDFSCHGWEISHEDLKIALWAALCEIRDSLRLLGHATTEADIRKEVDVRLRAIADLAHSLPGGL